MLSTRRHAFDCITVVSMSWPEPAFNGCPGEVAGASTSGHWNLTYRSIVCTETWPTCQYCMSTHLVGHWICQTGRQPHTLHTTSSKGTCITTCYSLYSVPNVHHILTENQTNSFCCLLCEVSNAFQSQADQSDLVDIQYSAWNHCLHNH